MTSALTFQNTHFDVIEQKKRTWLTATQISTALGFTLLPRSSVVTNTELKMNSQS